MAKDGGKKIIEATNLVSERAVIAAVVVVRIVFATAPLVGDSVPGFLVRSVVAVPAQSIRFSGHHPVVCFPYSMWVSQKSTLAPPLCRSAR
jgi:hypothetical protein